MTLHGERGHLHPHTGTEHEALSAHPTASVSPLDGLDVAMIGTPSGVIG